MLIHYVNHDVKHNIHRIITASFNKELEVRKWSSVGLWMAPMILSNLDAWRRRCCWWFWFIHHADSWFCYSSWVEGYQEIKLAKLPNKLSCVIFTLFPIDFAMRKCDSLPLGHTQNLHLLLTPKELHGQFEARWVGTVHRSNDGNFLINYCLKSSNSWIIDFRIHLKLGPMLPRYRTFNHKINILLHNLGHIIKF